MLGLIPNLLLELVNTRGGDAASEEVRRRVGLEPRKVFAPGTLVSDELCRSLIAAVQEVLPLSTAEAETLELLYDMLQRGLADLEARHEVLAELDRLKTDFFANVSHELRTPLTLILGPVESLLVKHGSSSADPLPEHVCDQLERVRRNGLRLTALVDDLLDYARIEAGKVQVTWQPVDPAGLVQELVEDARAAAESRNLTLTTVMDLPPVLVPLDARMFEKILLNLLSNALKFTPAGGSVEVRCGLEGRGNATLLVVSVSDTGIGIPKNRLHKLFKRFSQVDASAVRRHAGTGLGLALVKEFAAQLGGTVGVESEEGHGSTFTVQLPLQLKRLVPGAMTPPPIPLPMLPARRALQAEGKRETPAPMTLSPPGNLPRVLVADDHEDMRRFLETTLADKCWVAVARDGQEALQLAKELVPDLVITDLMMPRFSGEQLLNALRAIPELAHVPVLMLTAKVADAEKIRLLRAGAQDFLTKPFVPEELKARAENLISLHRARSVLARELAQRGAGLEELALEVTRRKREAEAALDAARVAREAAERANAVKTTFLNLISHELRTPLATLTLSMEAIQRDPASQLSPWQQRFAERMERSIGQLSGLIESVLEYTKVEGGRLELQPEPIDPQRWATSVLAELEPEAQRKGLRMSTEVLTDGPLVTDARVVRLVALQLLSNAIRHTHSGTVTLKLTRDSASRSGVLVSVRDTGDGIPLELQDRIFQPFEHLEPIVAKHTPGLGLGLALVQRLVQALGGRLELVSAPGQGSTFTVALPQLNAEAPPGKGKLGEEAD